MNDSGIYLLSGATAGIVVEVSLYPFDTIRTRLQSAQGLSTSGGFRGIYAGIPSAALASIPSCAVFFLTYESVKCFLNSIQSKWPTFNYMLAASCGEATSSFVRVPFDMIKQRAQASPDVKTYIVFRETVACVGLRGLYRGYYNVVCREIPFSLLQVSLWESFKDMWAAYQHRAATPLQSAMSGALAGGIAAAITTPLDVAQTRVTLAERDAEVLRDSTMTTLKKIYATQGWRGLFSGILPRIVWITAGGALFCGVYDKIKCVLRKENENSDPTGPLPLPTRP